MDNIPKEGEPFIIVMTRLTNEGPGGCRPVARRQGLTNPAAPRSMVLMNELIPYIDATSHLSDQPIADGPLMGE